MCRRLVKGIDRQDARSTIEISASSAHRLFKCGLFVDQSLADVALPSPDFLPFSTIQRDYSLFDESRLIFPVRPATPYRSQTTRMHGSQHSLLECCNSVRVFAIGMWLACCILLLSRLRVPLSKQRLCLRPGHGRWSLSKWLPTSKYPVPLVPPPLLYCTVETPCKGSSTACAPLHH